jgi:preprotein translocase subunit SecG
VAINFLLLGGFQSFILGLLLFFTSLFLIFIVLIQRGRGGGLTGALGGTGQSAFGSRAGDELTYITLVVAGAWIFLCVVCIWVLNPNDTADLVTGQGNQQIETDDDGAGDSLLDGTPGDSDPIGTDSSAADDATDATDDATDATDDATDATDDATDAADDATDATDDAKAQPTPLEPVPDSDDSDDGDDEPGDVEDSDAPSPVDGTDP